MILIERIKDEYWKIIANGTNPNDYTVEANQKIIIDHNWLYKPNGEAYGKNSLVWNDNDQQLIIYPDHLKLVMHKEKTLAECRTKLKGNLGILDKQILKDISKKIADAATIASVDEARAEIDSRIDDEITDLGF